MTNERIEVGDKVNVRNGDLFIMDGVVRHVPQTSGEAWIISSDNRLYYLYLPEYVVKYTQDQTEQFQDENGV